MKIHIVKEIAINNLSLFINFFNNFVNNKVIPNAKYINSMVVINQE
jgi:hypothetical protein